MSQSRCARCKQLVLRRPSLIPLSALCFHVSQRSSEEAGVCSAFLSAAKRHVDEEEEEDEQDGAMEQGGGGEEEQGG